MTENAMNAVPYKLTFDMSWKCWDDHAGAFRSLVDAVSIVCPRIRVESRRVQEKVRRQDRP